jgi:hypothetical protein
MIGIYLMGFVILVGGVGVLGTAIAYAVRPTEQKLMLMRPLSLAAIFAAICSSSVGFATVLQGAAATTESVGWSANGYGHLMMGVAECFIPPFVAFAFLAVAWLLVAVGMRRTA